MLSGQQFRLADFLERSFRQLGAGADIIIDEQQFAEQASGAEACLVELADSARVDEASTDELNQEFDKTRFSVAALTDHHND